ncbi:PQQ-binding-like beta-propeller repeat protein [Streptomyces sp. NPDC048362]|uniref:beta-alanine-activating enzyme beta-propeller domain-containing protein n=1 Tax=Streptomyces sp. NPDC048362 TaxID=3365539 RepID=UPI003719B838
MSKHSWPRRQRYAAFIERHMTMLMRALCSVVTVKGKRVAAHAAPSHNGLRFGMPAVGVLLALSLVSVLGSTPATHSTLSIATDASSQKNASIGSNSQQVPENPAAPDASPLKLSASVSDWPMWRNNAQRNGNSAGHAIVHRFSVNSLQQKWRQSLGDVVTSSAVIAADSVFIGSRDGSLYSLDSQTGSVKWRYATGGSIESSPAIMDGKVFFTSSDGGLYAVDAVSGHLVWSKDNRYSASSPLIYEGAKRADSRIYVGSSAGELHVYDLDGNLLWAYTTGGAIESSPTLATVQGQDMLFFGSNDSYVYALSTVTHQPVWKFQTRGSVTATPATDGAHVYVGSRDGRMYALDARNGAPIWTYNTNGPITSSAAVSDADYTENSRIYVGSQSGQVYAIGSATGSVAWLASFKAPIVSSPVLAADVLYVGAGNSIVSLSAVTGNILWKSSTGGAVNSSPSLSDAILVVGSADSHVYAFCLPPESPDNETPSAAPSSTTGNTVSLNSSNTGRANTPNSIGRVSDSGNHSSSK